MNILAAGMETHLLVGLAVAVAFSIAVLLFSAFQNSRYLLLICLACAAAYYQRAFVGFLLVNAITYACLCGLDRQASRARRWTWACVVLILLVAAFTAGRLLYWGDTRLWFGSVSLAVFTLDMWMALRLLTIIWEVGSCAVPLPSVSRFIVWSCLPLTLTGPILRYSQMPPVLCVARSLWTSAAWWRDIAAGAFKLIAGFGLPVAQRMLSTRWPQAHLWTSATTVLFIGPVGFYLTYAGYYQLMETLGRPSGVKLPVSFNSPLGRENISAFWMNWNMTATHVFRDYLFYNRWGFRTYNVYLNTMILFLLMGLWHAANAYWLLFGFLHGLLFCSFLLWRKYNHRLDRLPLRGTPVARTAARTLTYLCVCACWYVPSKILQTLAVV